MYFIVLVGPAGSGKSTLAGELSDFIESHGPVVARVNFDPAAEYVPYSIDVDARRYVSIHEFMAKGLGPNGALIAAVDSLINHVLDMREELERLQADYVVVDTPGQMELFAYRYGGPVVLNALTHGYNSLTVFLMDAVFFENPAGILSMLTLASSVAVRLQRPQINTVSKADLLTPHVLENIVKRLGEDGFLEALVSSDERADVYTRDLMLSISVALRSSGFIGEIIPISISKPDSLAALYAKIQQIARGGEEPKSYDFHFEGS